MRLLDRFQKFIGSSIEIKETDEIIIGGEILSLEADDDELSATFKDENGNTVNYVASYFDLMELNNKIIFFSTIAGERVTLALQI